ncbi:MAG: hypothetical protein QOH36_2491 [Actinomycetota bacterium]|nr:hypothetical protein [Actinomycetota bacterium]
MRPTRPSLPALPWWALLLVLLVGLLVILLAVLANRSLFGLAAVFTAMAHVLASVNGSKADEPVE